MLLLHLLSTYLWIIFINLFMLKNESDNIKYKNLYHDDSQVLSMTHQPPWRLTFYQCPFNCPYNVPQVFSGNSEFVTQKFETEFNSNCPYIATKRVKQTQLPFFERKKGLLCLGYI